MFTVPEPFNQVVKIGMTQRDGGRSERWNHFDARRFQLAPAKDRERCETHQSRRTEDVHLIVVGRDEGRDSVATPVGEPFPEVGRVITENMGIHLVAPDHEESPVAHDATRS